MRRPRLDYESHAVALDRNELGALLVTAGLRVSEATGADIKHLGLGVLHAARVRPDAINIHAISAIRTQGAIATRPRSAINAGGRLAASIR